MYIHTFKHSNWGRGGRVGDIQDSFKGVSCSYSDRVGLYIDELYMYHSGVGI